MRFAVLLLLLLGTNALPCQGAARRLVGIGYQVWFPPLTWDKTWDTPELGRYTSTDTGVITQHARWLAGAGVDFLWVDWSNNARSGPDRPDLLAIENATDVLFETYAGLSDLPGRPRISVFLGIDGDPNNLTNGSLQRLADKVYDRYVANPRYRPLVQDHAGKPLMVVYMGTPTPFQSTTPNWDDPRFTLRWMTGFQDDQPNLIGPDRQSKYGYWSWWDRSPQTYASRNGRPEAMVVSAAFPGTKGWDGPGTMGRRGGKTFHEQWLRAREVDPEIVVVNSWNEWVQNEELTVELSNDIEPSVALGRVYLDQMKEEIALYKAGRNLQPADAVSAMRFASGFAAPTPEDFARLNLERFGPSAGRIDVRDAMRVARTVFVDGE